MKRRLLWLAGAAAAAMLVAGCLMLGGREAPEAGVTPLILDPENPARSEFGRLTYIGGLVWQMERPDFGGLSALHLGEGGAMTVLTDKAHWIEARLIEDEDGVPRDIRFERIGRLRDAEGVQLERPFMDSEALARRPDGGWLIAFEQAHRVTAYRALTAPGEALPLEITDELDGNSGLESMAFLPDGRLVLIAEDSLDRAGDIPGWIVAEDGTITRFAVARSGGFRPTDLAIDPAGGQGWLLERRFSMIGGVGVRLRRFALDALEAGAVITGEALLEAGAELAFDNMEGLQIRRAPDGGTLIYMLSDDNFNPVQRTILLKFWLAPG